VKPVSFKTRNLGLFTTIFSRPNPDTERLSAKARETWEHNHG
jgi:hypothetical protein